MIPFIEYLFENFAPEVRPVIAGLGAKIPDKKTLENIVDIVWLDEKKIKQIAQYLKKTHNIKVEIEQSVEGEDVLELQFSKTGRSFQLFPDNVLVLYPDTYTVYDTHHEPDRVKVHQMNMAYPKKFKFQKKA